MPASVYAIDLEPVRGLAACATRMGTIHLLSFEAMSDTRPPREIAHLLHGRPILSVCFADTGDVVSADDSGQVLCWRRGQESVPEQWLTNGPVICSVSNQAEPHVVGLGVNGHIICWDPRTGKRVATLVGPPPILPLALARLTSWTSAGRSITVYPAQEGRLAVILNDRLVVHTYRIHEGRFHAIFQTEDRLVTIGHDDGVAKLWRWSNDEPICDSILPAFAGVIDAKWNSHVAPQCGVAVLRSGNAVVFTMASPGLQITHVIPGDSYRVAAAAPERLRRQAASDQAERRATELHHRIMVSIEGDDTVSLEDDLLALERLGHRSASLRLRARRASRTADELAELQALHHLVAEWSGSDRPATRPCLERYIDLLLHFGHIELVGAALHRIEQIDEGLSKACELRGPKLAVEALRRGCMLVREGPARPDHLHSMLQATQLLGSSSDVLWELHRSPPILLPDTTLHPQQLAEALRGGREADSEQHSSIETRPVLWMHGRACQEDVSVLLPAFSGHLDQCVRIALRVAATPSGSDVTRSVLLVTNNKELGGSDDEALGLATQLQDDVARMAVLAPVNDRIILTLRKIRGAALAMASDRGGGVE